MLANWVPTPPPEEVFPNLAASGFETKSEATSDYNCIAFSVGVSDDWWWPTEPYTWPTGIPRERTLASFQLMYEQVYGYEVCDSIELEEGMEKVAIYTNAANLPTHAALQLSNGKWKSKLGNFEDIEHNDLYALEDDVGTQYGHVALIMKKPRRDE